MARALAAACLLAACAALAAADDPETDEVGGLVLEGTVVDPDGRPISRARVWEENPPLLTDTWTDASGRFRLLVRPHEVLADAAYLSVAARGFCEETIEARAEDADGSLCRLEPIVLARAGAVRGVVVGPSGPEAGVRVTLNHEGACGCGALRTTTDDAGRFAFEGVRPREWLLEASAGDARALPRRVRVEAARTVEPELVLRPGRDVQVDVRTAAGAPVEARAVLRSDGVQVVPSRGGGCGAPTGSPLRAPAGVPLEVVVESGALSGRATLPPDATRVEVTLEPSRRLRGRVVRSDPRPDDRVTVMFEARDPDGLICRAGVELRGLEEAFELEAPIGRAGRLTVHRDGVRGLYLQRDVGPGEDALLVGWPDTGRLAWTGDPAAAVRVAPDGEDFDALRDERDFAAGVRVLAFRHDRGLAAAGRVQVRARATSPVDLPLAPALRVRGRAVDARGRPVRAGVDTEGVHVATGKDGRFEVALPPGDWRVHANRRHLQLSLDRPGARPVESLQTLHVTGPGELDLGDVTLAVD